MKQICVVAMAAAALVVHAQVGGFKPYSVSSDFHEVANLKQFTNYLTLAPEHKALLQRNLFVVSPSENTQLYEVYGENDYHNLPSLVTTDTVLHLYHVFFDSTLRKTEQDMLMPRFRQMTAKMLAESRRQAQTAADAETRAAALKNVEFFEVASDLIAGNSPKTSSAASAELQRINAASGFMRSAIFPYEVDYSRFIVRGHYTKSPTLKRYFRAMTWYGLMPFALADKSGAPMPEQIRMAVLAAEALRRSGAEADWQTIYDPTALYVGTSNTITPHEIRVAAIQAFGSPTNLDTTKFASFVNEVRALRTPPIQSRMGGDTPNAEVQFRFMGLRYVPDSEILQRLSGESRQMPSGLDVMAILGSHRAAEIMDANPGAYDPGKWSGYHPERARLAVQFAELPVSVWQSNLYWGWFDTLRLLLRPVPTGYPQFMLTPGWQDKNLSTALASWTELRHDTILYGEQSVAEQGDDQEPPPPFVKGFVEPNLPVYKRLQVLSRQSRTELQNRKLLDKDGVEHFKDYEKLLDFLISTSEKELAGKPLTKEEHLHIRHIEADLADLTADMLIYGNNFNALTQDDWDMALIADVHTGNASALEEAVGRANDLIAIVPIEGKLYFARGSVFSYFEFTKPVSQRMTDEAWKAALRDGKSPAFPSWTSTFATPKPVKEKT